MTYSGPWKLKLGTYNKVPAYGQEKISIVCQKMTFNVSVFITAISLVADLEIYHKYNNIQVHTIYLRQYFPWLKKPMKYLIIIGTNGLCFMSYQLLYN